MCPDCKKIAFSSNRDGNYKIYVINEDGTNLVGLTDTPPSYNDYMPTWSPDSKKILFYSNISGNHQIYIMNADGTGTPVNITNSAASDASPTWSPNGSKILYESFSTTYDLWTINPDSPATSQVNITNTNTIGETRGSWLPDGLEIIFAQGSIPKNIGKIYYSPLKSGFSLKITAYLT